MMKRIMMALAVCMLLFTVDASAQNFMKKVGKAVEKEVNNEVKEQVNKGIDKIIGGKDNGKKSSKGQAASNVKSTGEKKFVKNIDVFYKSGMVQGNYKLYYDGSTYYVVSKKDKEYKLIPCDGIFNRKKYYFFFNYMQDMELLINEDLPGAVGERVVRNGDEELKVNRQKYAR